jgi:hypothetical protein
MFRRMMIIVLFAAGLAALGGWRLNAQQAASPPPPAPAEEAWLKQFNDVCSDTQDAMSFSEKELTLRMGRCDGLQAQIQKLEETRRKVYEERLRKCRGLYAYVLDAKKKNEKK